MGIYRACQHSDGNYAKIGQIIGTTTFEEMAARVESIKFCCIRDKQNDSLTIKPVADDGIGRLQILV